MKFKRDWGIGEEWFYWYLRELTLGLDLDVINGPLDYVFFLEQRMH